MVKHTQTIRRQFADTIHSIHSLCWRKNFLLKDLDSIKNNLEMLDQFYMVSGLRPNLSKIKLSKIMVHETLSQEGKIIIFKSVAISKIVNLVLLTIVPKNIVEELNEIQKKFLWSNKKYEIKHGILCNDYKNEGFFFVCVCVCESQHVLLCRMENLL